MHIQSNGSAWHIITTLSSGGGGGGSIGGSTGSNDNRLIRANGTGGSTIQASGITVDDSDNMSGIGNIVIDDGSTIGSATTTGALTIASNGLVTVAKSISIVPLLVTSVSKNSGSPTSIDGTRSIVYFDLNDASAMYAAYTNVTSNGQVIHIFYDNDNASGSLRIDFWSNRVRSSTGLAQYLTCNDSGQSSSIVSIGDNTNTLKFCIMNSGATVS